MVVRPIEVFVELNNEALEKRRELALGFVWIRLWRILRDLKADDSIKTRINTNLISRLHQAAVAAY